MEGGRIYNLPLELARGTLNRLRNQLADWQLMGLAVPPELVENVRETTDLFAQAATSGNDPVRAAELAQQSITKSLTAIDQLMALYSEQATAARLANASTLPTFLAVRLDPEMSANEVQQVTGPFNSAMIPFNWRTLELQAGQFQWDAIDRQFEACREAGLRVLGGPLLQLDVNSVPEWLYLWEEDFDQVQQSLVRYVRAVVERYRGHVNVWNCAARMNLVGALGLSEEERLRLVVAVIDEVQRLDPRTPYIVSFDQPWAEYLALTEQDFSPLHFADSLARAELGLAGIGIEMNFGYGEQGSQPRDLLEINRLLDRWNLLGLPLLVLQAIPGGSGVDAQARVPVVNEKQDSRFDCEHQRRFGEQMLRLVLAKSFLHGFVWLGASDARSHEFAHSGLLNADGHPKPLFETLLRIRQQYLS